MWYDLCRSKARSLPSQLKQSLAPRDKEAPPTFLDFDFVAATSEADRVKMTVSAGDRDDDDDDDDDADNNDVRRRQHHRPQNVDSASVDLGSTVIHS